MSKLLTTTTRSLPLRLLLFRRGTSSSPISTLSSSGGGGDGSGDGGGSNPTTWPTQQTQLRALPLLAQSCHAIRLSSSSGTPTLSLFMLKSPPRYYSTTSKAPEPRKWSFEEVCVCMSFCVFPILSLSFPPPPSSGASVGWGIGKGQLEVTFSTCYIKRNGVGEHEANRGRVGQRAIE